MARCDSKLRTTPSVLPDRQLLILLGWRTGDIKVAVRVALAEKWICKAILHM
jgi:hypothetical protein